MLNNAQRVLTSAVNILEEEIAAGIVAAKRIEKKIIDVDEVRSNPENLMNRFRRDTHEVVDIFLDSFASVLMQMKLLSNNIQKQSEDLKTAGPAKEKKQEEKITVMQAEEPSRPGETTVLYMNLSNEKATEPITVQLQKDDLTGPMKQKISASNIKIQPSTVIINPGEEKEIAVHIKIPATCKPGNYNTLLTDTQNAVLKAILSIEVL